MARQAEYNRIGAAEAHAMKHVMHELLESSEPARSISELIAAVSQESATAFERYAATVLNAAGGQRLKNISRVHPIKVIRPDNGRLAQIVHEGILPPASQSALLATECALNRLLCIADSIADGRDEDSAGREKPERSISIFGGGYLSTKAGWRSARVKLPTWDASTGIDLAFYNEVDWRVADCVASNARAVFQRSMRPNAYRTKLDAQVGHQSDWDIRTRLAQLVNALELPYRCSFRFDYDENAHRIATVFTCPPTSFLPSLHVGDQNDVYPNVPQASISRAYEAYLLRLACLFGAACFGCSGSIEGTTVVGYDVSWSRPLIVAQFTRDDFVRSVLVAVDNDDFSRPEHRFDPESIAAMITASHLDWVGRSDARGIREIALPDFDMATMRTNIPEPGLDERPLNGEARQLFRCGRICDVDTSSYFGGHADAVDLARQDVAESPIAAVMRLESLIEELEQQARPVGIDPAARPLYAPHPLARLAICLLDDDLSVAKQAEAFLRGNVGESPVETETLLYFRAPSALFHARFGLSDLYQSMGDFQGAELQADRCIALAPTTASAYYRKADVLAEQGLFDRAANVLMAGLTCATTNYDSSMLYYYLGMLYWNMGEKATATAIHAYNASLKGDFAERSARVVQGLREHDSGAQPIPSPFNAKCEMKRLGIPIAPISMRDLITKATIALANAGTPYAAAPYAEEMERLYANDEIIAAACRSLRFGCTLP